MKKILIKILRLIGIKANEDNLKLKNIKRFLQAKWRKKVCMFDITTPLDEDMSLLADYKKEQIKWRYQMLQSHPQGKQCLLKGECPCECDTLELLLSDSPCDKECFPEMMTRGQWKKYKKDNKIC